MTSLIHYLYFLHKCYSYTLLYFSEYSSVKYLFTAANFAHYPCMMADIMRNVAVILR